MLLAGTERDYVLEKLKDAIFADMRAWFGQLPRLQAFRDDLPDLRTARDLAAAALTMAMADGGRKYRGALEGILEGLDPELDTKLAEILERVRRELNAMAEPGADPFAASVLAHKVLFWNRRTLRDLVKEMTSPAGKPILLINGESGLGKSYSLNLLTHLKFATQLLEVAPVLPPLDPDTSQQADAAILAADILAALGVQPNEATLPSPLGKTENQYVERLCRWLLNQIPVAGPLSTIVLDGFGLEGVSSACRAFIARLAQKLVAGLWRQRLRLVLIHYPTDDLAPVEEHRVEERVQKPTSEDLKHAVASALAAHGQNFTDEDLNEVLNEILARVKVPDSDSSYYRQLNREMRVVLNV